MTGYEQSPDYGGPEPNWRSDLFLLLLIATIIGAAVLAFSSAFGQSFTDQQIVGRIIQDSRQAYYATGHPCACPDDLARNGSRCGARSRV